MVVLKPPPSPRRQRYGEDCFLHTRKQAQVVRVAQVTSRGPRMAKLHLTEGLRTRSWNGQGAGDQHLQTVVPGLGTDGLRSADVRSYGPVWISWALSEARTPRLDAGIQRGAFSILRLGESGDGSWNWVLQYSLGASVYGHL